MTDMETVDARGLACPEPVIRAKKAIAANRLVLVIVDNEMAMENVKRLGAKVECRVEVEKKPDGTYHIGLEKTAGEVPLTDEEAASLCAAAPGGGGPFVIALSDSRMGRGSDELGGVLMRAFLHTVAQQEVRPDVMIFYNAGVQLTVQDSPVLDDLLSLAGAGVEMLVCGTCVNYFDLGRDVAVGTISNMYDIASAMSRAGRLVKP